MAKITHLNAGFHSGNAGCAASSEGPKHCFKRTAFITDCGEMRTILKNGSMYGRIPFARDWFLILINGLTKASLTNYLGGTDGGSAERRPTGVRREHNSVGRTLSSRQRQVSQWLDGVSTDPMGFRRLQFCEGFDHALAQFCVRQSADAATHIVFEMLNVVRGRNGAGHRRMGNDPF
jgi:hypothetical protein